jgi:hypothetical protein
VSLIIATEPLAILSANPIQAGQILDVHQDLARQMVRAGLAVKAFPFSLAGYPVRIAPMFVKPPIHVHTQARSLRRRKRTITGCSKAG